MDYPHDHRQEAGAFSFDGTWREYAPIALTNLLLTIVTLGIYRFWATARTRRYLWSRTRFIDDRLEWAGTGLELFKGAVTVLLLFGLPYLILNFVVQRLTLNDQKGLAAIITLLMLALVYYLVGLARFRALRYRLSRTYWRGIRGGSDNPGWTYGLSWMWKNFVGTFALGLLIPWSMASLWNERWRQMSFGPYRFDADVRVKGLMGRFLLCYLAPFAALILAGMMLMPAIMAATVGGGQSTAMTFTVILLGIAAVFAFYFIFGLVLMAFYAKFFRQAVEGTRLHTLDFAFSARTMDWIKLFLGDVALIILTLGIGSIFVTYRHWKFTVSHMHAYGHIDVDELTQSTAIAPREGEGLLDAFDMGAF